MKPRFYGNTWLVAGIFVLGLSLTAAFTLFSITSITLNSPTNSTFTSDNTPDFNFTALSDSDSTLSCSLIIDSVAFGTNASANNNTATTITANTSLSDGARIWGIDCTDTNGTVSSENRTLTVDTQPPSFNFTSPTPANGSTVTDDTAIINITVEDATSPIDTCTIEFDGANDTMSVFGSGLQLYCESTFPNLAEGEYNYTTYVNDSAGNSVAAGPRFFTVNADAPVIASITAGAITASSATISWETDEAANSTVSYGIDSPGENSSSNSSLAMVHSITLGNLDSDTTYFFNVTSCNALGVCNTTGTYDFTTLSSGGGGGGGALTPIVAMEVFLQPGQTEEFELRRGESVAFELGFERHSVRISQVSENSAEFVITSAPQRIVLNEGQSADIDTNDNKINDLQITLLSVEGNLVTFSLAYLQEIFPEPPQTEQPVTPVIQEQPFVETNALTALLALLAVAGLLYMLSSKKRSRKSNAKKSV